MLSLFRAHFKGNLPASCGRTICIEEKSSKTQGSTQSQPGVAVRLGEIERLASISDCGAAGQLATGRRVRQPGGASGMSLPAALRAMRRRHFLGAVCVPHTPLRCTTQTAQRPAQSTSGSYASSVNYKGQRKEQHSCFTYDANWRRP